MNQDRVFSIKTHCNVSSLANHVDIYSYPASVRACAFDVHCTRISRPYRVIYLLKFETTNLFIETI